MDVDMVSPGVAIAVLAMLAVAAGVLLIQRLMRRNSYSQIHRAVGPLPLLDPEAKVATEPDPVAGPVISLPDKSMGFAPETASAKLPLTDAASTGVKADFNGVRNALIGAGATSELAPVLLAEGQALVQSGNSRDGSAALRRAIEVAVQCGVPGIHALARLELAEIARIEGDLTTACEHWHLAKKLFSEQNLESSAKSADGRMREHGCPTEWVLTDF